MYGSFNSLSAPVFVLERNAQDQPVFAALNTAAAALAGVAEAACLGRTAEDVFPAAYGRQLFAHHVSALQSDTPTTYAASLPVDDKIIELQTTLTPKTDAQGKTIQLFGVTRDISAEREAQHARAEFDTMTSEMEQFVAFAAHDLRAPMRNIAVLTDMLRQDLPDAKPATLDLIRLIDKISHTSLDLIGEVLSHVHAVGAPRQETAFSLPALCQAICDIVDPSHKHRVHMPIASIQADRGAVQIAVRNLIENAVKHGGRDALEIALKVERGLPGLLEYTLTDNGGGFGDQALKTLNSGQFSVDGGYGLFGIKRMISARGGTLAARNLPGGAGTCVKFSLPGKLLGLPDSARDKPHATQAHARRRSA
ncbi:MAG: ATP-binding protein [Pseudomonadota bacterium]